MNDVR